ncbi:type IV secretion system DNA-binding domain-containing protein [Flavobacterium sp. Sd200]|uniref:conjugal transfer protein MobC n=1 Tax=Flavobacterium sp. Sd200 TaxID=2692211 RepID=UPI001369DD9C|nr:conjugal transfer protein MobC [Flavobacterium sp. Sd200]MXN91686.1 type IV secretion system DNA-binding domain-containing protein [Flavobacterium sp. Sd200]
MGTGENEQALRKIADLSRLISIVFLVVHFYYSFYALFHTYGLHSGITDRILAQISHTGLFDSFVTAKVACLIFLVISLLGVKGRKDEKMGYARPLKYMLTGLTLFFGSVLLEYIQNSAFVYAISYVLVTVAGYLFTLTAGVWLGRIIKDKLDNSDIFNRENETFPQEERLLENEYSVNLPAEYQLRKKKRRSWINIINPFRGLMVLGTPGAGKSYFVIRHVITQHLAKGFSMFVYDFKFDDLSRIAYNAWLKHRHLYAKECRFYLINFDDLTRSHRCNPLEPSSMTDITDAAESARTILMGLNREWIKKQGDFFVESPINFVTAIIWFLKKYRGGEFCTLPHVIELMQADYNDLFTLLRSEKEIEVLINPFVNAYLNDVMEQLEGQIASAKVAMARLSSPQLYYVLSGNDFTLDINNPEAPKVVCMGNNPQKIQIYGAVLSLYVTRLVKQVNKKGQLKSSLVFDEFPTLYLNNMDSLIATARSNKVATCLGIQDFSQLRKDYGREQADVIVNIVGNIISGQVTGDSAKQLSERFGKIMQRRQSLSINSNDTSVSHSRQLDSAIPQSRIATMSSGEFVGIVADEPDCPIELKAFHANIQNDHAALKKEVDEYKEIEPVRKLLPGQVQQNYLQIKQDIKDIIDSEMQRLMDDPSLTWMIIRK